MSKIFKVQLIQIGVWNNKTIQHNPKDYIKFNIIEKEYCKIVLNSEQFNYKKLGYNIFFQIK